MQSDKKNEIILEEGKNMDTIKYEDLLYSSNN